MYKDHLIFLLTDSSEECFDEIALKYSWPLMCILRWLVVLNFESWLIVNVF